MTVMKALRKYRSIPVYCILTIIAFVYIYPLLLMFTNALMTQMEIQRKYSASYSVVNQTAQAFHYAKYSLIPEMVSLEQYKILLIKTPMYLDLFMNSVKLTLPIIAFQGVVGTFTAYGLHTAKSKWCDRMLFVYIIVMVLPYQSTMVPHYIIIHQLGLINTHLAVILPAVFSPFAVFVMHQSLKGIPEDIYSAAQMDGADALQRYLHIALPLAKGGVASLAILSFVEYWGSVEMPMIFIQDQAKAPLSLVLSKISSDNMGLIFAASVFYMLPALWVFLYGQEYFEQGIMLSALK